MGQCLGKPIIPSVNIGDIVKWIGCLCTCCGGSVIIYKSELDGKDDTTPPAGNILRHQVSFCGEEKLFRVVKAVTKNKIILTRKHFRE